MVVSSFSTSSIQSERHSCIKAAKQLQTQIGLELQSQLSNLSIKRIGVETIYVYPTSSPEEELFALGKREICQLKEAQAFEFPKQQTLNSY